MFFSLELPQGLYYRSANSKDSVETALMRRLTRAVAVRQCDKYPFTCSASNLDLFLKTSLIYSFHFLKLKVKVEFPGNES